MSATGVASDRGRHRRWGMLSWRERARTLRVRVTIIASMVMTVAIVTGIGLLYLLQIQTVHRALDAQLGAYVSDIADTSPNGNWPTYLPPSNVDGNVEAQVVGADGTVLAATRTLAGVPPVYALPDGASMPVRLKAAEGVIPGDVRVIGIRRTVAGRQVSIIAGTSTSLLTNLRSAFTSDLLIGFPLILLAAGCGVWFIVGRALRPVDRIRSTVADITSADLSRRVPDPGTADEIGSLAHTMNDMLSRLESSADRQRRFVADASHELRSPLAAIRTTLEVGLAHPDRAPWLVIAERATEQSARLEVLIQQLLLLARADERSLSEHREDIDVFEVLTDLLDQSVTGDIAIDLSLSTATVMIGNPAHIARVFRNIIDNAVRHATTTIQVTSRTQKGQIVVEITDDGPGVGEGDRDRIFDRFVRLDSSRGRGTGTSGLGLAIAREITTAHQGSITVLAHHPHGARFVIQFPAKPPHTP